MKFIPTINKIGKWIGTFLLVIGFIQGVDWIWDKFFSGKKTDIQYEILSSTNVLDINENISNLDIIYNDISLKKSRQSLRIINLKVTNTGRESITANSYDVKIAPLGFSVTNGTILEKPDTVQVSNLYLRESLKITLDSTSKLAFFSPVIIDPGDFFYY